MNSNRKSTSKRSFICDDGSFLQICCEELGLSIVINAYWLICRGKLMRYVLEEPTG